MADYVAIDLHRRCSSVLSPQVEVRRGRVGAVVRERGTLW